MIVRRFQSLEIGRFEDAATEAARLELEIGGITRLGKRFGETHLAAGQTPTIFDRQQDVRRPAAIGDKDSTAPPSWRGWYPD